MSGLRRHRPLGALMGPPSDAESQARTGTGNLKGRPLRSVWMTMKNGGPVRYVALLRGIAPLNPNMRNQKLRSVVESLGFHNVETVISSGNVVFDADSRDVSELEARIEEAWPEQLGFQSTTIIRTGDQMHDLVAKRPFGERANTPATSLQVTFLKQQPDVDLQVPYTPDT